MRREAEPGDEVTLGAADADIAGDEATSGAPDAAAGCDEAPAADGAVGLTARVVALPFA